MLLCFDFALLRSVIGVELKLASYFKQSDWKLNPIPILVTCIFSRFGQMTCLLLFHLIILLNLIWFWFWFYNTQLKCPLKENPIHSAYLKNSIYVKPLNYSSSRFWFNTLLSTSTKTPVDQITFPFFSYIWHSQ